MIREASPIIVVNRKGVIIYSNCDVIFPYKDPPENPQIVEEIGIFATTMYYVASMKASTYRSSTLDHLNSALRKRQKHCLHQENQSNRE